MRYRGNKISSIRTNERTNERTDGRTARRQLIRRHRRVVKA